MVRQVSWELLDPDELQATIADALREAAAEMEARRAERSQRLRELLAQRPGPDRDAAVQRLCDELLDGVLSLVARAANLPRRPEGAIAGRLN